MEPNVLLTAIAGARSNDFATLRWSRPSCAAARSCCRCRSRWRTDRAGELVVEMSPVKQQARQDREERLLGQAQANKELIRNLAHETANPLGGRGAQQLLQMEVDSRDLVEYTQVIIHEADRLQTLVDRSLCRIAARTWSVM